MAGGKTLNAWVVLGGKVDNSFTALGNNLTMLGSSIDGISQKLINFGKESVSTYRSYEDSMLDAQVALATTYGRGSKELNAVMTQLDRQASEWAATTIFHTDDVAAAIAEAAHANWDLDKILEGMPAAMRLAQAGGMDLSTGLDYIIKSTNAAQISFADLNDFIDVWTYAANSSAGTVEEFGEAMTKMGATMRFADNKEELLTMLAVLHDAGTTGDSAGTLLRNTMIRLVAPTKKAADAMEDLGVAQSDLDEAMSETDGDLTKALQLLGDAGFSAYTRKGELKDFVTIFEDLNRATKGMSEEDQNTVWSAIFPTRTITGAMALIDAAKNNWNGLLDALNGGEAKGYGQYAADIMMSGLTGVIETFNSKVEDLRKELGQQLAPQLKNVAENFGKVIDLIRIGGQDNAISSGLDWLSSLSDIVGGLAENLQGMDPAVFDGLVAGLGGVAALGPTILGFGFALRTIGWGMQVFTGSTVGKIVLAAAAIGILTTTLQKYQEAKFVDNFGDLKIDTTGLDQNMESIKAAFEIAIGPTNQFAKALEDAVTNYNAAAQKFSETMLQDVLTPKELTGEERDKKIEEYKKLGSDMVDSLKEGISARANMDAEFWAMIFKGWDGTEEDLEGNDLYGGIIQALTEEKGDAIKQVEDIGKELEEAIIGAWNDDGVLTEDEREKIKEKFQKLNEAIAEAEWEAQQEQSAANREKILNKLQGMSYEQMMDYNNNTINQQRQEELDTIDDYYAGQKGTWKERARKAREKGDEKTAQDYEQKITSTEGAVQSYKSGIYSWYDQTILDWFTATLADSNLMDNMPFLQQAAEWMTGGVETNAHTLYEYLRGNNVDIGALQEYYLKEVNALGGVEEIKKRIADFAASDDKSIQQMGKELEQILAIYSILNPDRRDYNGTERERTLADYLGLFAGKGNSTMLSPQGAEYLRALLDPDYTPDFLQERHDAMDATSQGYIDAAAEEVAKKYNIEMLNAEFGGENGTFPSQLDDRALAMLLSKSESERRKYEQGSAESIVWQKEQEAKAAREAFNAAGSEEEANALYAEMKLKEQAAEEARLAYDAAQGILGNPFHGTLELSIIPSIGGILGSIIGNINIPHEAKGGRETRPSIFAEAGIPEWYIPEEHTPNTARLILAAANNSGFSILDLAAFSGANLFARGGTDGNGTLSAPLDWGNLTGSGRGEETTRDGGMTVQYSPVIHANDTSGMKQELEIDRKRFEKLFNEMMKKRNRYKSIASY